MPARKVPTISPLGAAVRARRKNLRLSQEQLGRLSGCGRIFIHALERGKKTVRLDKVLDVLRTLGLQLAVEAGKDGLVARTDGPAH